jgi:ABC-type transport system involved in cytochrome c biogenesis ATPase subunit
MLTTLEIQNFKAFGERVRLDLRPLTVLVGPNGSGKTSILDAVGLLSQSAPLAEHPPQMKWKERLVDLGPGGASAFHKLDDGLLLSIEVEAGSLLRSWFRNHYDEPEMDVQALGYSVAHRRDTDEWKHELTVDGELAATNYTTPLGRGLLRKGHGAVLECNFPGRTERVFDPIAHGNAVLAPKLFMGTNSIGGQDIDERTQRSFMIYGLFASFMGAYLRQRVFMVGSDRTPRREQPQSESGPLVVGRRGERTLTVLSVIFAHAKYSAQAKKIQHWASVFGLGSLASGWIREELLHAGYMDSVFDTPLGIESAGSGAQQILPIITQIFSAPANSVLLIEEPEAGLHPESHVHLCRMFADAASHGHQLLVTTHSQAFLNALSASQGPADDVAVYGFSKSPAGAKPERLLPEIRGQRLSAAG